MTLHAEYQRLGGGEERQAAYLMLFQAHLADKTLNEIRQGTNKTWVLGRERFKRRIEAQLRRRVEPKAKGGTEIVRE